MVGAVDGGMGGALDVGDIRREEEDVVRTPRGREEPSFGREEASGEEYFGITEKRATRKI